MGLALRQTLDELFAAAVVPQVETGVLVRDPEPPLLPLLLPRDLFRALSSRSAALHSS